MHNEQSTSATPNVADVNGLLALVVAGMPGTTFTYRDRTWERGQYPSGLRVARLGNLVLCPQNPYKSSRWAIFARQGHQVWWIWENDASGQRAKWLVRIVDGVWTELDEEAAWHGNGRLGRDTRRLLSPHPGRDALLGPAASHRPIDGGRP